MRKIAKLVVRAEVIQNVLRRLALNPIGLRTLNRVSYPNGIFSSIDDAWTTCKAIGSSAHHDSSLINFNYQLSVKRRISDYPVLFWLQRLAIENKLRVFDFGGGLGQTFFQYADALGSEAIEEWTVMDLPDVIESGKKVAADRNTNRLKFTSSFAGSYDHHVFLAAGALHYWETDMADLSAQVGGFPDHVIINRSPLRLKGAPYITLQMPGTWRIPCVVRTAEQLKQEFSALHFLLVDEWDVPEKTLAHSLFPDYLAPYSGMYFKRKA